MTLKYGSVYIETGEEYMSAQCLLKMIGDDCENFTEEESVLHDILYESIKEYEVGLKDDEKCGIIEL